MLIRALYGIGVRTYTLAIRLASVFSSKAAEWIKGREVFPRALPACTDAPLRIWFHCASLGEFEQGRPVIEALKARHPDAAILLSFFSPSGYRIRKDYPLACQVVYLPQDTHSNARKFVKEFNPHIAVFVKYEFWYNYLDALKERNIPYYFISSVFRKEQVFFRPWGKWFHRRLSQAEHIYVQDEGSLALLQGSGLSNCSVSGDTRYDRVSSLGATFSEVEGIREFLLGVPCIVAGSTWPEDERMLDVVMQNAGGQIKLIIAPHEVGAGRLRSLMQRFAGRAIRYSELSKGNTHAQVLLIDNVGMLSRLYRYAALAWVGGAFKTGLHNILEPAAHGKPVIFGPHHKKFPEASALIIAGGAYSINSEAGAAKLVMDLMGDPSALEASGRNAMKFVSERKGACARIMSGIGEMTDSLVGQKATKQ